LQSPCFVPSLVARHDWLQNLAFSALDGGIRNGLPHKRHPLAKAMIPFLRARPRRQASAMPASALGPVFAEWQEGLTKPNSSRREG
jgi:hypothetical protein